ncbi:MAG: hypothetical protein JNL11_15560 [Bdellovibrionaceae bacterium]|nr:hypothetical protein [Pseudobdellovibrionaceae bacterium]
MRNKVTIFILTLVLSLTSFGKISPKCKFYYTDKTLRISLSPTKDSKGVQIVERMGHTFKLIDLSQVSENSLEYAQSKKFLNEIFVRSLAHLNKDQSFIDSILRLNPVLMKQMHILLMFDAVDTQKITAGSAFIVAKKPTEKLAFEKELDSISVDQIGARGYPIAEIARVGMEPNTLQSPEKFRLLIDTIFEVSMLSLDIHSFYVFTSRFHRTLYKRYGYDLIELANTKTHPQLPANDLILEGQLPR